MTAIAAIALIAIAVTVASLVYLHISPTGLNPVRDAVSRYGITDYRTGYRAAAISLGISALALAVALAEAFDEVNVPGTIFLILLGLARLLIGWVPMDAPGAEKTASGRNHNLLAAAFFACATVAAFLYTGSFAGDPDLVGLAPVSAALAWALTALSVLVLVTALVPALRRVFGLVERLLYVAVIAWIATVAITLIAV
jgi:hypothetical protein